MNATSIRTFAAVAFLASAFLSSTATCSADSNPLRSGGKALLFQASSDIQLSAFNGGTISLKHHTSPGGAWRFGMTASFSTSTQEYDEEVLSSNPPGTQWQIREDDRDDVALSLAVERLRYLNPEGRVSFFYGIGPNMSGSRRTYKSVVTYDEGNGASSKSTITSLGVGVGGVIGVEWFPHEQIGILGQYGSNLVYNWKKTESESLSGNQARESRSDSNELTFRADVVRLGISVYW